MSSKAEAYAHRIHAAIRGAREDGVNVTLDWDEDEDGMHVMLFTSVHQRDEDGIVRHIDGPFIVEGF